MSDDSETAKKSVGARIAALRRRARLSKAEVARRMGVDWGTVRRWEQGEHLPPGARLVELAAAIEAAPAELLGTETPVPEELVELVARIAREHPERLQLLVGILRAFAEK